MNNFLTFCDCQEIKFEKSFSSKITALLFSNFDDNSYYCSFTDKTILLCNTKSISHALLSPEDKKGVLIYGTDDGQIVAVQHKKSEYIEVSTIKLQPDSITSLAYLKEKNLIFTGQINGLISVFIVDDNGEIGNKLINFQISSSITKIHYPTITDDDNILFLVLTKNGNIHQVQYSDDPLLNKNVDDDIVKVISKRLILKTQLEKEVELLERNISKIKGGKVAPSDTMLIRPPVVTHSLTFNKESLVHQLVIESVEPIDCLVMHAPFQFHLLDPNKNMVVSSISTCDCPITETSGKQKCVVNIQNCAEDTTHIQFFLRLIEGQYGSLTILVSVRGNNNSKGEEETQHGKAVRIEIPVKPLSMHHKMQPSRPFDEDTEDFKICNEVTVSGMFSKNEIHSWFKGCLPDFPVNASTLSIDQDGFVHTVYECCLLQTSLHIKYRKAEAVIRSNNLSTCVIVHDYICKEAAKRRQDVAINIQLSFESVLHLLERMDVHIANATNTLKNCNLLETLEKIVQAESAPRGLEQSKVVNCLLPPVYAELVNNAKTMKDSKQPSEDCLQRLQGLIVDLYMDYQKYLGLDLTGVERIVDIMQDYSKEKLIELFQDIPRK